MIHLGSMMDDQAWVRMKTLVYQWISDRHDHDTFLKQFASWLGVQRAYQVCYIIIVIY